MNKLVKLVKKSVGEVTKEIRYLDASSRPKRILFDHLPKCGGSTLVAYLDDHYPQRKIFRIKGDDVRASVAEFQRRPKKKRLLYELIRGHRADKLIKLVHPDIIKITMLRDPIERIISHYYYVKRQPSHYLHSKMKEGNWGLRDYVLMGSESSEELMNWYVCHFSGMTNDEVARNQGDAVRKALDSVTRKYDVVGFLDDFPSFIEQLRRRAGLRHVYNDIRVNVTRNRPNREDLTPETIRAVEELNLADIDFYEQVKMKYSTQ